MYESSNLSALLSFLVTFIGSAKHIKNPYLRARLVCNAHTYVCVGACEDVHARVCGWQLCAHAFNIEAFWWCVRTCVCV